MAAPLLQTKLYIPPLKPEIISRPRLVERLNAGLDRKLTLVSAPAGFGKTTLLSEWIHCRDAVIAPAGGITPPLQQVSPPLRAAWLSLDDGDNDLGRFLTYLVAVLHSQSTGKGHNRSIYGKLQVTSRTQAIARARELGLL